MCRRVGYEFGGLLVWFPNAPSCRIIYQFTPDPCESEDTLYRRLRMTRSRHSSKIGQLCLPYTPPAPLESQNLFSDAPTAAEIFWVSACLARHSPRKLRNDPCNRLASNFLVGLSSTNGVRRTLPIAPSATSENPWDIFKAAARSWKSHALLLTT